MAFVGTWTFSGVLDNNRDKVRSEIGDVDPDDPLISDERIAANLTSEGDNILLAAGRCALQLQAQYSRERDQVIAGAEGRSVSSQLSQRAASFGALAKSLFKRAEAVLLVTACPYAGGISIADKEAREANDDRVMPAFSVGMMDNNG